MVSSRTVFKRFGKRIMDSSIFWLAIMMVAAAITVFGNSKYQSAKEREKQQKVASNIVEVLQPEMKANEKLVSVYRETLALNRIPIENFSTTAWETVSVGGLLLNLDSKRIELFTWNYYLIRHCIELKELITRYSSGVEAAMGGSPQMVSTYIENLRKTLNQLTENFKKLDSAAGEKAS